MITLRTDVATQNVARWIRCIMFISWFSNESDSIYAPRMFQDISTSEHTAKYDIIQLIGLAWVKQIILEVIYLKRELWNALKNICCTVPWQKFIIVFPYENVSEIHEYYWLVDISETPHLN